MRFYILFIYFTQKKFVCCFYTIKALLNFISSLVYTIQKKSQNIYSPLLFSADSFYKIKYMKINYFSLFVLLCSITLFGLIMYRYKSRRDLYLQSLYMKNSYINCAIHFWVPAHIFIILTPSFFANSQLRATIWTLSFFTRQFPTITGQLTVD